MNGYAIYHRPESEYAYALDERTLRIVLRVAENERLQAVELLYNNKYDFTKRRNAAAMKVCASDGVFAYYVADITLADLRFAYIFKINEQGRTYYYSESGLTESYDFALAYYDFFQFPFVNSSDIVKRIPWTGSAVFYQIFIDRFCRGNFTKNDGYVTQKWEKVPTAKSYCGGDLRGITQKLGYLAETGINALYLTPVFTANSNHKYNISSYSVVDPQFGSNGDLCDLLKEAHARGMRVVLDTVFNHCDCSHEYFADAVQKGRASEYYDWFLIDGDFPDTERGNYAHFADCKYMPKWNTNNSAVRQYLIGIALSYLQTGFDGLRLDVADEVSHTMWRELRGAVKTVKPDALLLGEVWHENTHYLRGDEFDGVMNYRVQKAFIDYFACGKIAAKETANRLNRVLMQNFEQVNAMMLNFLDNHDTPRFLRFCGGEKDRLLTALCALVLFPGMPCIYYGTELPLDGGGDPDCRRTFDWTFASQNKAYFARYKRILSLKKEECAQRGRAEIKAENGLLTIVRESASERITAVFNMETARSFAGAGKILYEQNYGGGTLHKCGVLVYKEKI